MSYGNILPNSTVSLSNGAVAAGVTTVTATHVDHDGARSVVHRVILGAVIDGTVSVVKVQQGDASDDSDMADVTGLAYTILDADDNHIVSLELAKPSKRFSRVVVTRTVQNVTIQAITAERFNIGISIPPVTRGAADVGNVVKNA